MLNVSVNQREGFSSWVLRKLGTQIVFVYMTRGRVILKQVALVLHTLGTPTREINATQ